MKVLIPTDFSNSASKAFDYAYQMYKGYSDVEFVLLNSFEMPPGGSAGGVMMNLEEYMERESERDLAVELKKMRETYPGIKVSSIARYGSIENSVSRTNLEMQIDMVVIGTHGASGFKKALIGSNAQKVIENVTKPVIAVPNHWEFRPIKKIVYATDLERIENPESLNPIKEIAAHFGSKIHIVYVAEDGNTIELEKEMENLPLNQIFKDQEREFKVIESKELPESISDYMKEIDADMVVVMPKQASFWEKLLKQSVTEQLVYASKIPILAIRDIG